MNEPVNEQARQRIRQLFRFLQAFNEKKNPIPTQISEQARVRRWHDFPTHPNLSVAALEDTPLDDADASALSEPEVADFVLKVRRADVPPHPTLPELLAGWVVEGWEDPRQRPVTVASRPTSTGNDELFDGDPQRATAFKDWTAQWETWAGDAGAAYEVNLVFNWLFDVQADMEREAERHELVLGDGLLNWYRPSGGVSFPVLLQRLQIEYDARIPEFTVSEADRPAELNAGVLRRCDVDGSVVAEMIAEAERLRISPLGAGRTTEFLRRLVATIAADGQYVEEGAPQGEKEFPRIGRDPVVFMRNRAQGFEAAISNILEDIETREEFPESLLSITGIHSSQDDAAEPVTWEQGDETSDVLLSKEANREQLEIARRLARYGAVRVQGPPGTGKTHTIANLVGHLLAHEKSVLVTSHTTKALRVLRDKIVPELQPLSVSVLEGDAAGRSQLSASITTMSARLGSGTRDQLLREAARLRERREALLSQIQEQRARLLAAVGTEYEEVVFQGIALTTEQAARLVAAGVGSHDWIPGTVSGSLPLSLAEIDALYAATARISLTQERTLEERLPPLESLLQPSAFEVAATRCAQIEASGIAQYRPELWDKSSRTADRLRSLAEAAKAAAAHVSAAPDWYLAAAAAGDANEAERIPWLEMVELLQEAERTARDQRLAMVRYGPRLCDALAPGEAIAAIREVRDHIADGNTLGRLTLIRHGRWRKVVQESSCLDVPPWTVDALDALATVPSAVIAWQALVLRWDLQFERFRIEPPREAESTDRADEEQCHRFAMLIEEALELATQRIAPVMSHGSDLGLDLRMLAPDFESSIPSADRWRQLGAAFDHEVQVVIESELARIEHAEIRHSFSRLAELLKSYSAVDTSDSPLAALLEATVSIDPARYAEAHVALVDLLDRSQSLAQRQAYLLRLSPAAPDWAEAIRLRRPPHDAADPPGDARKAWEWSTIHDELERRCSEQIADLIAAVEALKGDLREVTTQLIDRLAWAGQMKRTDPASRQRLQLWLETIKRIGKGSGKNVPRLRRAAQEHMAAARNSVPVWIAPLSRVAESFDARTTHFDVVIIDEASQCDVMSLADYERRRILCGTPPQFQGDERDVIFLSVVEGPPESPPLRSLGEGPREMYKKRYNVAASRARDQLWVVHSLDPGRDLKPDDLRWRLLDFARNPEGLKSKIGQAQARSESPLETAVIQRVVTAGYPVTPQFEVGGYRIDLVVGTEKRRLAVECDGDRYHTQDDLQHDLERQALLERLGWRFVRIRGGEFFRDPDRALQPLFKRLAEMGISPSAPESSDPAQQDPAAEELLQRVRRRAAEIRASWDTQPTGRGAGARDEEMDWGATTRRAPAPPKAPRRTAAEPDKPERTEPVLPPPAPVAETPRERRPVRQTRVASDDLIATLEERGIDYIDKRPNDGALWAIGGADLSTVMSDLAKRGYNFTFSASGGRATMHRPGWWFVK